jgi:hypothetical protein
MVNQSLDSTIPLTNENKTVHISSVMKSQIMKELTKVKKYNIFDINEPMNLIKPQIDDRRNDKSNIID